jgi:hypothetical protein
LLVVFATDPNSKREPAPEAEPAPEGDPEGFEGLTAEEDWVVPGTNLSSLSLNTELGQAVDAACDELDHLGAMENEVLQEADDILKKFGFKPQILASKPSAPESDTPSESEP